MIRRNARIVDAANVTMLRRLTALTLLLLIPLMLFSSVVASWHVMLPIYIALAVLSLTLLIVLEHGGSGHPRLVTVLVYLSFAALFGIFIFRQTMVSTAGPILSFTILMFVLPFAYIDRPLRMNCFLLMACAAMVAATLISGNGSGAASAFDNAANEVIVTLFAMITGTIACYARVNAVDARNSLHQVLSQAPVGISVYRSSAEGVKVVYLSETMAGFYGEDIADLTGELDGDIMAHVHPDDMPYVSSIAGEASRTAGLFEGDFRALVPGGGCRWVRFRLRSVEESPGVHTFYIAYSDVDAQKRAELGLAERYAAEQRYLDSLSDSYLLTLRANLREDRIERSSGVLPELAPGVTVYSDVLEALSRRAPHPADREELLATLSCEALLAAAAAGRSLVTFEHYSTRREGAPLWIRTTAKLIRRPASDEVIAFIYVADITPAKIRDILLDRVVEEQFDFIAYVSGAEQTLTLVASGDDSSDMPAEDVALDYDEAIEQIVSRIVIEQRERVRAALRLENVLRCLGEDDTFSETFCVTCRDTRRIRFKKMQFFLLDPVNRTMGLIRSDYTQAHAAQLEQEQVLRQALSDARDANRAKTEFLSRMSHDIRTPLNGVIGMTALAEQEENPPRTRGYLEKIDYSSRLLLTLVNDILDVSRVESGRMELHPEPYSNREFFRSIDATIRPLCDAKHIVFSLYAMEKDHTVMVDPLRFDQVFYNLLSNAVKFTPEGGHVSLDLEDPCESEGIFSADFVVRDDGIGMGAEFMRHIFEPFEQERVIFSDGRQGTGLGLTIVKSLVDLMGGTIAVRSTPGAGSEFRVHLDLPIAEGPAVSRTPSAGRASDLSGRRLLVAEDNAINTEIITTILRRSGATVDAVPDGARALAAISQAPAGTYDAVLMDIRMPVMDGLTATRRIRALPQGRRGLLPIIAMTANAFEEDVRACLEAGMDAHVAKPLDPAQVAATLLSLIDMPRPADTPPTDL